MTRWGPGDDVTVQIHGGPPHKTAVVTVGDTIRRTIRLNGCGAGSTRLVGIVGGACVEIAVDNHVLLTGRLAAAPSVAGDQP